MEKLVITLEGVRIDYILIWGQDLIILLLFDRQGMVSFVNNFLYELCFYI